MINEESYVLKDTSSPAEPVDQHFFGHGKLLLSGEYFVMDGAQALAFPTKYGQSLNVKYSHSFSPKLVWKSYDVDGKLWFKSEYEFWHFKCLDDYPSKEALILQRILKEVRKINHHFLRQELHVEVETHLGFPRTWGLGSSSTLMYNIAQWAYVSPFELFFNCFQGSGYDIACAQSDFPILYEKTTSGPLWSLTKFNPPFKDNLFFIYSGKKMDSQEAVSYYQKLRPFSPELIMNLSTITKEIAKTTSLMEFNFLVNAHEKMIARHLKLQRVKELYFKDFWGEIKSLGAWGGDFVMATSTRSEKETKEYFNKKGFDVVLRYDEIIAECPSKTRPGFEGEHERILQ